MSNVLIKSRTSCNRCQVSGIGQRGDFITEIGTGDYSTCSSCQVYTQSACNTHQCNTHSSNGAPGGAGYDRYYCGNQKRGYQHEGRVYNLYTIINHHRDSTRSHPGTNQRTNAGQNQDCRHALSNLLADFVHHFIPGNTNAVSNQAGNSSYQKQQRLGCVTQITFADSQNNHHGNNRNNGFRKGWHTPICFFFSFLHIL